MHDIAALRMEKLECREGIGLSNPKEEGETAKLPGLSAHHIMEVQQIIPAIVCDINGAYKTNLCKMLYLYSYPLTFVFLIFIEDHPALELNVGTSVRVLDPASLTWHGNATG